MKVALPMLLVGPVVGLPSRSSRPSRRSRSRRSPSSRRSSALVAVVAIAGPWMLGTVVDWTTRALGADPDARRDLTMNADELLAQFSEQQVAGVLPRPRAGLAAVHARAAVLEQDDPGPRPRRSSRVALTVGIMPVVKHGARSTSTRSPSALLILKEVIVGLAFAYALGRDVRRPAGRGLAARHADRLLLRRARRPGHRHAVGGARRSSTRSSASRSSSRSAATPGSSRASRARYDAVPLLDTPAIGSMVQGAQVAFSGIFVRAFMIGAPVILALIITDAAFGVVSRVVPQMNVFAVGFPAKMIVGLTLLGASLPFVSGFIADQLQRSVAQALHTLKVD